MASRRDSSALDDCTLLGRGPFEVVCRLRDRPAVVETCTCSGSRQGQGQRDHRARLAPTPLRLRLLADAVGTLFSHRSERLGVMLVHSRSALIPAPTWRRTRAARALLGGCSRAVLAPLWRCSRAAWAHLTQCSGVARAIWRRVGDSIAARALPRRLATHRVPRAAREGDRAPLGRRSYLHFSRKSSDREHHTVMMQSGGLTAGGVNQLRHHIQSYYRDTSRVMIHAHEGEHRLGQGHPHRSASTGTTSARTIRAPVVRPLRSGSVRRLGARILNCITRGRL